MGHSISDTSDSRDKHLKKIKRQNIPLRPEYMLEAEALNIKITSIHSLWIYVYVFIHDMYMDICIYFVNSRGHRGRNGLA